MSMKSQKVKKRNKKPIDCNNAIYIRTKLIEKGIFQRRIAEELGVTDGSISNFINGVRKSKRFSEWCYKNLGIAV